jgi:uncharacterized protein (UPF0335 family)
MPISIRKVENRLISHRAIFRTGASACLLAYINRQARDTRQAWNGCALASNWIFPPPRLAIKAGLGQSARPYPSNRGEHMSAKKTQGEGGIGAERLRSFVDRIERLEEEKAALTSDIRDVYSEAKGAGFDVKIMRQIVRLRKMEAQDRREQEELLDLYKRALEMD